MPFSPPADLYRKHLPWELPYSRKSESLRQAARTRRERKKMKESYAPWSTLDDLKYHSPTKIVNYSVKPYEQSQAGLSYAMAKDSLIKSKAYRKRELAHHFPRRILSYAKVQINLFHGSFLFLFVVESNLCPIWQDRHSRFSQYSFLSWISACVSNALRGTMPALSNSFTTLFLSGFIDSKKWHARSW